MGTDFPRYWMWSEAFEALARAERMHRQFFQLASPPSPVAWEPPVDVLETDHAVLVLVALPGVDLGEVKALIDQGELFISGIRAYPAEIQTATLTGARKSLKTFTIWQPSGLHHFSTPRTV